jgi:hypothetical protein
VFSDERGFWERALVMMASNAHYSFLKALDLPDLGTVVTVEARWQRSPSRIFHARPGCARKRLAQALERRSGFSPSCGIRFDRRGSLDDGPDPIRLQRI